MLLYAVGHSINETLFFSFFCCLVCNQPMQTNVETANCQMKTQLINYMRRNIYVSTNLHMQTAQLYIGVYPLVAMMATISYYFSCLVCNEIKIAALLFVTDIFSRLSVFVYLFGFNFFLFWILFVSLFLFWAICFSQVEIF